MLFECLCALGLRVRLILATLFKPEPNQNDDASPSPPSFAAVDDAHRFDPSSSSSSSSSSSAAAVEAEESSSSSVTTLRYAQRSSRKYIQDECEEDEVTAAPMHASSSSSSSSSSCAMMSSSLGKRIPIRDYEDSEAGDCRSGESIVMLGRLEGVRTSTSSVANEMSMSSRGYRHVCRLMDDDDEDAQ